MINYEKKMLCYVMLCYVKYPDVYSHLLRGSFSFQKSSREFSRTALDQVHEQYNRTIKTTGGTNAMNKFHDSTLIRWETCGTDIARLVLEFEDSIDHAKTRSSSSSKNTMKTQIPLLVGSTRM